MPEGYRTPGRKLPIVLGMFFLAIAVFGVKTSLSDPPIGTFYYPPGNAPPGPPPNYNQVDTSYFLGTPAIPLPPPDSGGVYIWVDSTGWNIANHIYSQGNSLEQFHGSVLAILDSPPTPGLNVFTDGFELFGDTTANSCYLQNDRWGWYQWSENLYEIWWDVSTREWQQGSGDPNDFMVINISGCAIDFNVWSSGHGGGPFDTDQIYLGGSMVPLSSVPGFVDTYPGVSDPYQSQAGPDPTTDPNITIFTGISGTGASYSKDGLITSGKTYPCGQVLGEDYGDRFMGPFVYEGNGIQFSSFCFPDPCEFNNPPSASSPDDTTIFVCVLDERCLAGFTCSDPDNNLLSVEVIGGSLSGDTVCFIPVEGTNTITLICTDECGATDTAITVVTVDLNEPPVANSPNDTSMFVCDLRQICISGFTYSDVDGNISSVDVTGGAFLSGDTVCFTPVSGDNIITMIVTDECGVADTATTVVTVNVNTAPLASCPGDTNVSFVCEVSEICIGPFVGSDVDGNLDSAYVITEGFSGTFDGTTFCFTPNLRAVYQIKYVAVDLCGVADTCAVNVDVQMTNEPPTVQCPGDTSIVVCDLSEICIPGFNYGDANNNIATVEVSGGTYDNGSVCFTPEVGPNTIALTVTDSCGVFASCTTTVTVIMNSAPEIICINDTTMVVDDLSDICLTDIVIADPDGNIASIDVTGGFMIGNEVCFTPVPGINTIIVVATDECGEADTCAVDVTIGYCAYLPGDANADFSINGLDITIMVYFFKGGPPLPDTCDCRPDVAIYPFFGAGDVNGDCAFNGVDVTYLYNYLIYIVDVILYCPSCPPTGGWVAFYEGGNIPRTAGFKEAKKIDNSGIEK